MPRCDEETTRGDGDTCKRTATWSVVRLSGEQNLCTRHANMLMSEEARLRRPMTWTKLTTKERVR